MRGNEISILKSTKIKCKKPFFDFFFWVNLLKCAEVNSGKGLIHAINIEQTLMYNIYTVLLKAICPLAHLYLFGICHTYIFQIIEQMLILDKDQQSKYKKHFLKDDFIYLRGKMFFESHCNQNPTLKF